MTGAGVPSSLDTVTPGHRAPALRPYLPGEPSMWFFVIGDFLIFGAYFAGYVFYRGQDPSTFLRSQATLNLDLGFANTIALLTSSMFVALAVKKLRTGDRALAQRLVLVAILCGAAFPMLKAFEYVPKILDGSTPGSNLFFMFYFVMTGLHLCHVLLGLVILGFVLREVSPTGRVRPSVVETGATYWHMVDVLWLVLFALLYLMR